MVTIARPRRWIGGLVAALIASGAFAAARVSALNEHARADAALHARVPRQGRPGGYVSSNECRACHPGEYATWHRTYHRTMTQLPTPEAVKGDFDDAQVTLRGATYRM